MAASTQDACAQALMDTNDGVKELWLGNGPQFVIREVQVPVSMDWLSTCNSPSVKKLLDTATRFALAPDPVLIVGECGTGKTELAHFIRSRSNNGSPRLVCVECGKLGFQLVSDSEAVPNSYYGLINSVVANREITWLFDRVDEVPLGHQAVVSGIFDEIQRSQHSRTWPCIISTSRPGLEEATDREHFRQDLYYKLNVLELTIPPLRERKEDIFPLVQFFLAAARQPGKEPIAFTPQAISLLSDYHWPGNVVELRNVVSKLSVLTESSMIDSNELLRHWKPSKRVGNSDLTGLKLEDAETHLILEAISRCDGNKTAAAKQLGITARTLHNKLQKYRTMGYVE